MRQIKKNNSEGLEINRNDLWNPICGLFNAVFNAHPFYAFSVIPLLNQRRTCIPNRADANGTRSMWELEHERHLFDMHRIKGYDMELFIAPWL